MQYIFLGVALIASITILFVTKSKSDRKVF